MTKKRARRITLPRSVKRLFPQVETAVDADEAIEVSVSRNDCKQAKKLNPSECALARAAKRELHADAVIIGMSTSYVIKGTVAVRFSTPMSVQREIISFDRHQDFSPGDYYLNPKSPSNRIGAPPYKSKNGNHKTKRKIHHSARVRILPRGAE
jgi:hypothetical protein